MLNEGLRVSERGRELLGGVGYCCCFLYFYLLKSFKSVDLDIRRLFSVAVYYQ